MPLDLFTSPVPQVNLAKFGPFHWNRATALLNVSGLNVQAFGAVGDGVADDTAAIAAALTLATTTGETVILPAGTFKLTATLTVPIGVTLQGQGGATVVKPSSAVTTCAVLAAGSSLEHLYLDGVNTTGCVGVSVGAAVTADHVYMRGVTITRFIGTNAVGLSLGLAVTFAAYDCYLTANEYNLITNGASTPTNSIWVNCQFRVAVKRGAWVKTGYSLLFLSCLFESNQEEGLYIANTTAANAIEIRAWGCWFENNWDSIALGAGRHVKYECVVDGSAAGTIRPEFRSCYFNGGPTTARSFHFTTALGYLVDHVKVFNEAANILLDTNSTGVFNNWPASNGAYLTTVSDLAVGAVSTASEVTDVIEGAWATWTPTVTGQGAMTTTGLTILRARWKRIGHVLHISLSVAFTVGGTPNLSVFVSLPAGQTMASDQNAYLPGFGINPAAGNIFIPIAVRPLIAPSQLQVYRADFANWQAGAGQVNFHGELEVV